MSALVKYEELWEPWHIDDDTARAARWPMKCELSEELVVRFRNAKVEMQAVWDEIRELKKTAGGE